MPTELDLELLPEVLDVIQTYGRDATFTSAPTAYSPATGAATPGTSLGTVKVSPPAVDRKLMDEDLIQQGDTAVLVAGSGLAFTPAVNQTLTISGQVWGVVAVTEFHSGEQICAWGLHLRRGG